MKKTITIFIIVFITVLAQAQKHKEYFENGQLKEIGILKNEKEIGEWKWYYDNGQLESIGTYDNGHQTGEWKEYYNNGRLKKLQNFNRGFLIGKQTSYYDNGKLMLTGAYGGNNTEIGHWKLYHSSGKLIGTTIYKNGKGFKNGKWTSYNKDGTVDKVKNYTYGVKTGKWEYYYNDRKLSLAENYANGLLSGETKKYHDDGKTVSVSKNYFKGKLNGSTKYFTNTGKIELIRNYKDDKLHGEWKNYEEEGNYTIGNYKEGKLDGEQKTYDKKDNCIEIENYKDGKLHGEWKTYEKNGNYIENGNYKNGEKEGKWISYHKKNKIKKEELWNEGGLMNILSYYDENGGTIAIGTLKNGNGTVNEYDENGKLIDAPEYIYGKKINWNNSYILNSLAWEVYKKENESEKFLKAIKMIKRSIELDRFFYKNRKTYIALLCKTGNYEQALVIADDAIKLAKTHGDEFKPAKGFMECVNQKLKEKKLTAQVWGEINDTVTIHRGKAGLILLQLNADYTFKAYENTDFGAAILQTGNWSLKNSILTFEVLKTKNYAKHTKMKGKPLSDKESGSIAYETEKLENNELIIKNKTKRLIFKKLNFSYFPDN